MMKFSKRTRLFAEARLLVAKGILEADSKFTEKSIIDLLSICNGCGAQGARFDYVPDTLFGIYVGYACFIHDLDYFLGKDKKLADKRFKKNLLALVKEGSPYLPSYYLRLLCVQGYYLGVKRLGGSSFGTEK